MPSTVIGLRERKKSETRHAISTAALRLAIERGPDGVTVDDIAVAADVSPRTVFNHFGSKDEAILGIDPVKRAEIRVEVQQRPADETPLDALAAVLVPRLTAADHTGELWRSRARLVRQHPGLRAAQIASQYAIEHELAAAVGARTGLDPATNAYPQLVVTAVLGSMRVVLDRSASAGRQRLRRELDAALATLGRGMAPPSP